MGLQIEDGTGSGKLAEVDVENHLHCAVHTETKLAHRAHYDQEAFGISTPFVTVTATGGRILYIKNLSGTKDLYITDIWVHWDGGSTNFNRPLFGQFIFGDTVPDTNTTIGGMGNLNLNSGNTADATVLYWDEVGDGMTGHTAGTPAFYFQCSQGENYFSTQGAIIVGQNNSFSFNLRGHEIGEASINLLGYFED